VLARATEPTVWRAQGLLLASFLAAIGGDSGAVQPLLEQGTSLAGQLNDPATRAFAAWVAGHLYLFEGDLPQAIAYSEDGLAVLPAAVRGRQRAHLLICLANAAGLAGDEERVVACHRELAALTEAGSEYIRAAYSLWALGAAAWRRNDLDRATSLQQQSLRLRSNDRMGSIYCVEALAWIAGSRHQYDQAAILLGAATGLLQSMGTTMDGNPHVAGYHRDCENQARQALSEPAFQAAYHRVLALSADDPTLAVHGLVGLDRGSAFRAEKWAAPGEVPLDGVDDEGESPPGDLPGGLDCPVGGASSGLGLDFCGHDLPPVIALGASPG
jgi:tetratricopeptide (TPR) repeat protein